MTDSKKKYQVYLTLGTLFFLSIGAFVLYFIIQSVRANAFAEGRAAGLQSVSVPKVRLTQADLLRKARIKILRAVKETPDKFLYVSNLRYASNAIFGTIREVNFSLTNDSEIKFDRVRIKVTYIKADGRIYDTETVSVSDLKANSTYSGPAPSKWRGVKATASVIDFQSKELDELSTLEAEDRRAGGSE